MIYSCNDWCHPACVNLEEDELDQVDQFICPACSSRTASPSQSPPTPLAVQAVPEENAEDKEGEAEVDAQLYCLCKQIYDEERIMIACDKCVHLPSLRLP